MIDFEREMVAKGEAFRAKFAKANPNHPELPFIDAAIAGTRASLASLEAVKLQAEQLFYMIPEGEGLRFNLDIGGKSAEQLEDEVKATGREVTIYASDMIHSPKFEVLGKITTQRLLKFPVRALGLLGNPTTTEILERIPQCQYGEDALELPRAEVGPHKTIADKDQPKDDYYYVMHQPITDRYGDPRVFGVEHDSHGRFLHGGWADPARRWNPDDQLVVALRKIESVKP